MKERSSHKSIWFELESLLVLVASVLLCAPAPRSTAQAPQNNRQLKLDQAEPNPASGRRVALVIGNGAYTNAPPLKNPPNDARDMAATLKLLGFGVASGIDVNQRDMKRMIRDFGQTLKAGGSGLFYYAGHGVQSKGHNYLVPVDADIQSEAEVEDSGVDVNLVLNYMDDAQNGLNIVILDACRNNPFSRSFRSASNGLAQVDAPTGTLIAYATAPGRVASDGTGQNGLYTSELLKQMLVPGLSVIEMFMRVRAGVMKQTGSKQVPWEASSLVGMFYFGVPAKNSSPTTAANETKFDPVAIELSYWESIKNSTNAEDFKAYLEKYPSGHFASLVKNRISSLDASTNLGESKAASKDSNTTDLAFWDSVKNSNRIEDFQAYLKKYPNGAFTELANNRLAALETAAREMEKAEAIKKNSVEGTTWRGESSGREKHYEFRFLPNGEVAWHLKWRIDQTEKGTWRQSGNTIYMVFGTDGSLNMDATISGDKMTGSWAKGKYKFTVEKVP
ncbi:MAG TPA: caspase domain-containing protein [Pyrinomonadaceae bacterium]|nr:caspase domain-containing protein [Pyrinomonadaceae bacterium]